MKIALIGFGKMGREIEKLALEKGLEIVSRIDIKDSITKESIKNADVCIDFSHPDAVLDNIKAVSSLGKPLVIGTTDWYGHLDAAKNIAKENDVGIIYGENFSIGMHLFTEILKNASALFENFDCYDISLAETHHRQKIDAPSGTAKKLAEILLQNISRKKNILVDAPEGKIDPETLHVTSVRLGSTPGTHEIYFDSPFDTITLTHKARNRQGWAEGALVAAQWIINKKGLYHFSAIIGGR